MNLYFKASCCSVSASQVISCFLIFRGKESKNIIIMYLTERCMFVPEFVSKYNRLHLPGAPRMLPVPLLKPKTIHCIPYDGSDFALPLP